MRELFRNLPAALERLQKLSALNARWCASATQAERWQILRETYAIMTPLILRGRVSPDFLDWTQHRTPIEALAWTDIRYYGLPLYPQFPALRYFLDFADPIQKIAVELDGAAYHDAKRDAVRDAALLEQGWRTFRIPGKRALSAGVDIHGVIAKCINDEEAVSAISEWGQRWSEGFFWALGFMYYHAPSIPALSRAACREAAVRILSAHQLIDFDLEEGGE